MFDQFQFLRNRKLCIPPTQEDIDSFDLFNVNRALSMAENAYTVVENTNKQSFSKLTKEQQCKLFTSLDGSNCSGKWAIAKKKEKSESTKTFKEQIVKLFNCSEHQAETYIAFNLLDEKYVNDLYCYMYQPEKSKISKKKQK
jgi:hypothetical protein